VEALLTRRLHSVDGPCWHDPLGGLTGDGGDPIEIRIVVKDREPASFRCRGDEKVWHFATTLMLGCEHALDLSCSTEVIAGRLDELEGLQGVCETIPLSCAPGRVADL
jgi:hypothetical protein